MKKKNEKDVTHSLHLLAKSSLVVFIGVALSKILSYAYRVLIAREYGAEVYGFFSLAFMVTGIGITLAGMGLIEGTLRYLSLYRGSKDLSKSRYLFWFVSTTLTVTSLVVGIVVFLASEFISVSIFHNDGLTVFLKIFSVSIPFSILASILLSVLRSYEQIGWYSLIFNVISNIAKVVALGAFVFVGLNYYSVALSYLIGMVAMFVAAYWICKKYASEIFIKESVSAKEQSLIKKSLFSYSGAVFFSGIISIMFYWIDSFFLGYLKDATTVGIYSAASSIALLMGVIPELFMQLFFPLITKEYSKGNMELIKQLSQQVGKWIFALALPIFILIFLFPGAAINLIFGPEYLEAAPALRILVIGAFIAAIFNVSSQLISMIGKSKFVLVNIIISSLTNIILNMLFIPKYGLVGAASATVISILLFNLLFVLQAYVYLKILPVRRKMLRIALVSIIPTLVLLYLKSNFSSPGIFHLAFLSGLFVLLYGALIILTRCLDYNDLDVIKSITGKLKSFFVYKK